MKLSEGSETFKHQAFFSSLRKGNLLNLDTLTISVTFSNTICDVHEYMFKLNKYRTALVLIILNTNTNQNITNLVSELEPSDRTVQTCGSKNHLDTDTPVKFKLAASKPNFYMLPWTLSIEINVSHQLAIK